MTDNGEERVGGGLKITGNRKFGPATGRTVLCVDVPKLSSASGPLNLQCPTKSAPQRDREERDEASDIYGRRILP